MSGIDLAEPRLSKSGIVRSDLACLLAPQPVVADELAARVAQAQALAELSEIAAHAEDPEGLVRVAVHVLARGLDVALIALLEPDGSGALRARASTCRELVDARFEDAGSLPCVALDSGAPATEDVLSPARDRRLTSAGLASGVCVPLLGGPSALGVLCAAAAAPRAFDASEIQFLQIAANVLGGYLARHAAVREMGSMQARLALADRIFASATVAAGLAHEINNPLAVVTSNLAWIEEALESVGPESPVATEVRRELGEAIDDARRSADRMRDLVRDLRALNRVDETDLAAVALAPLVRACARIVSSEIVGRAKLALDLDDSLYVHGNEARLGQVFLNLLVNAAHAIAPGSPDSNEVRVTLRRQGAAVVADVRDTGRGIAANQLHRVFEPFYTTGATEGMARGRGLGLAICHQIVTSMGGGIEVESAPGKGSTFRVLLQVAPGGDTAPDICRRGSAER
jgi:signal transduction histidine kinase